MTDAALVLEGGGMRGIFTGGVLDVLMEKGMSFAYVVGVSAGACNAIDVKSRQIGRTRDCIAVDDRSLRYVHMDPLHILKGNVFDMEMLCHTYPFSAFPLDFETYFSSDTECEMVVTNCLTGRAEYLHEDRDPYRLMNICAASCSVPLINREVIVDGIPCLDGGVGDSVPVARAARKGWRKQIVVLTQAKGYRKKDSHRLDALIRWKYRKYPAFADALIRRNVTYNNVLDRIDRWEAEGHIFVIRPEEPVVGRTEQDPDKLRAFWRHGCRVMERRYEELQAYLNGPELPAGPEDTGGGTC